MAARQTAFGKFKSMTGAALVVLGMFILYQNLAGAFACLRHVVANGAAALGILPAAVLTVAQAVHAYAHHQCLQALLRQILISSWPLLLVICGTVLSRESFADGANIQEHTTEPVHLASAPSTYN
jgi:hypothetical protein